ncbi:phasin family protein [Thiomonas sp.]|jgi:hypothetical protein|uniref:phasin family protein n=1 Tax=Thiomonas sp. TaxID=2047785 RepID=UPI0026019B65|nr:phasin family protein [Thiomonas sp.]
MNPVESLQALQKAEIESVFALSQTLLRGFEQLTRLQLQMMRDGLQQSAQTLQPADAVHSVPAVDGARLLGHWQTFAQILAATQAEISQTLGANLRQLQDLAQDGQQPVADGTLPGAAPLQTLLQSAMQTTTQAMQAWLSAQQQAAASLAERAGSPRTGGKKAAARRTRDD